MKIRTFVACVVAAAIAAGPIVAAGPLLEKLTLSLEGAAEVMTAAKAEAKRLGAPGGSIAVVDDGGHLLLLERLDGTMPATPPVSIGKARTAAIFRTPTAKFEKIIRDGRTPMLAIEGFMPMQGGVPILVNGRVVGAIGVSGAASAPQDEEIALAGAKVSEEWDR